MARGDELHEFARCFPEGALALQLESFEPVEAAVIYTDARFAREALPADVRNGDRRPRVIRAFAMGLPLSSSTRPRRTRN